MADDSRIEQDDEVEGHQWGDPRQVGDLEGDKNATEEPPDVEGHQLPDMRQFPEQLPDQVSDV
jgi:hypothetical protein